MAGIQPFLILAFAPALVADPTEAEINAWANELTNVVGALDNIINFLGLTTPIIPGPPHVAVGANLAARTAHVQLLNNSAVQITIFQGLVLGEARQKGAPPRASIKVQRPRFDGKPENARGFHAALATYRQLRPGDFLNDETFIAWTLACMEGAACDPWKEALLNRRAALLAAGQPLPLLLTDWAEFLVEFQGRFLNPNEIENARRTLMALKQIRSAREYAQLFDQLAQQAGVVGQDLLPNQFKRNLNDQVQEN